MPVVFSQPPATSEAIMGYHFSLGNSSCTPMECDLSWINFQLPLGLDKPQYLKFIITPECWSNPPNENESYELYMYCLNGFNKTIDLKPAICNPAESIVEWVIINETDYGYFIHQTDYCDGLGGWLWCLIFGHQNPSTTYYRQYEDFWCAFRRPSTNLERLPTEMSIIVDSLGLTNPYEYDVIEIQKESGATLNSAIGHIFTINFNIIQICFYILIIISLIAGFAILVGGVPILLIWIFRKVTGD